MRGTSRAGWTAIHIAAEKAGIDRPVCGDGIEIEYREVAGHGGIWRIAFVGTNPGQKLRFVPPSKLKPSVSVQEFTINAEEVEERMKIHPEPPAPHLEQVRRMSKAFGPRAGYRSP